MKGTLNVIRAAKPEEVTVHLAVCFLQVVLNLCLVQQSAGTAEEVEIRPRIELLRSIVDIAGGNSITAEDDGGNCRVQRSETEEKDSYIPVVSDENLAQCLGEAIVTWKANYDRLGNGIFLIAATNTFIRFIRFTFGRDYLEYLDANNKDTQQALVDDPEKYVCVYMQTTKWLNLQSSEGRRIALCHVLALVAWHGTQGGDTASAIDGGSYQVSDDEMDVGE
ncbi:hypothetical protein MFIFM68171_03632 [Madurella fahalii]|uniref:Uncharacterized protein n=1 Tax=Madurella fahalii TaxID=1157608 RepID=A0ABQ0G6P2_9PEZI